MCHRLPRHTWPFGIRHQTDLTVASCIWQTPRVSASRVLQYFTSPSVDVLFAALSTCVCKHVQFAPVFTVKVCQSSRWSSGSLRNMRAAVDSSHRAAAPVQLICPSTACVSPWTDASCCVHSVCTEKRQRQRQTDTQSDRQSSQRRWRLCIMHPQPLSKVDFEPTKSLITSLNICVSVSLMTIKYQLTLLKCRHSKPLEHCGAAVGCSYKPNQLSSESLWFLSTATWDFSCCFKK